MLGSAATVLEPQNPDLDQEQIVGRPKDDWTEQLADEEMESWGEGARREMLDYGDSNDEAAES